MAAASQISSSSCRLWLEMMMVACRASCALMSWRMSYATRGSRPAVGSSSSTTSGSPRNACARATRLAMPCDRLPQRCFHQSLPSTSSSACSRLLERLVGGDVLQPRHVDEELADAVVGGQERVLRQDADARAQLVDRRRREAQDLARSLGGAQVPGHHRERRGLARAVGADEAVDGAGVDGRA